MDPSPHGLEDLWRSPGGVRHLAKSEFRFLSTLLRRRYSEYYMENVARFGGSIGLACTALTILASIDIVVSLVMIGMRLIVGRKVC